MRTFGQVPLKLWKDRRFRDLDADGRLALLYCWCGPHSTSAGIYALEDGYAALDLEWAPERWAKAFDQIEAAGLVKRDSETGEVLICDFFTVNRPDNKGARAAIRSQLASIESPHLRQEAEAAFEAACPAASEGKTCLDYLETSHLGRGQRTVRAS